MPWTSKDAKKHKRGLTSSQSKKWASIANSVLAKDGDDGKAIRIANAKCCEATSRDIPDAPGTKPPNWVASDAHRFKKGLSQRQAEKWARIANMEYRNHRKRGLAIRVASSQCCESLGEREMRPLFDMIEAELENTDQRPPLEPAPNPFIKPKKLEEDTKVLVSVDGKEIGKFGSLGSAAVALAGAIPDADTGFDSSWEPGSLEFEYKGKKIKFCYVSSGKEETPITDEDELDVALIVVGENHWRNVAFDIAGKPYQKQRPVDYRKKDLRPEESEEDEY